MFSWSREQPQTAPPLSGGPGLFVYFIDSPLILIGTMQYFISPVVALLGNCLILFKLQLIAGDPISRTAFLGGFVKQRCICDITSPVRPVSSDWSSVYYVDPTSLSTSKPLLFRPVRMCCLMWKMNWNTHIIGEE